ncbi:hypothetical protein HPSA20_1485 [Helicobacter pylori SouthAfrica20]|uniref:Uncharacterized protein n=1 Tax=Helicobacter pylori SouthAfrica20 TaxID=1352356 RepID=T1UBJ9_HELPX|nr:hypothetical protein HPSA20_1485 [Helicobacter pylori SouthAfrica20]
MGQTNILRSMLCQRHITNALGKYYTLKFQFLGLKWCFALNADFSKSVPLNFQA